MKIDLKKIYDTINWDFIQDVLTAVGFHNTMIKWIMTIMTCITSTKFSICVNGEINGYFNGGRGLRQGDPISPYLFTMVMEVFNMIMIKNVKESGKFRYHHGCKELKLTHMCFADDLLVLCKGDIESVKVVKKTIEEFSKVCGLFPNINKSTIFFGNIKEEDKADMLQVLPFKCGKLPMRYLGVLLLAKRLGVGDCQCLIENVKSIINSWKNRHLSYAGRIQLIASVLSTMQQYWASVYMLPDTVIKELDKLFKMFIWNAENSAKGKARVAWNLVCRSKEQDSCGWKNMLKLRDKVKDHVIFQVGNGKVISAWYDKWCKLAPLTRVIPNKAIFDARMSGKDCLADIICEGKWAWPDEWEVKFPEVKSITVLTLNDNKDGVKWVDGDNQPFQFSTKKAVILWMAIQERLLIQDKMCQYSRTVWDKISSKGEMISGLQKLGNVIRSMEAKSNKSTIWQVVNAIPHQDGNARIGLVAYRLRLPEELNSGHDTFHVSNLKKCLADASLHVPLNEIKVDKTLHFVEKPVEIMDHEIKSLKHSKISLVKFRWDSKRGPEFTWEHEDYMIVKYSSVFF
ncbi:RNA-directed DNA polymerase, eukaryota, reverse transcriptase zinc-binding domain protein [Tanacetum coccineum]